MLATWWLELDTLVRSRDRASCGRSTSLPERAQPAVAARRPRDACTLLRTSAIRSIPFAFLATYIPKLSAQGRVQHEPLGKALQEYAGAKNRSGLLSLLSPIQRATERSPLIKEMVESGEIYHPWPGRLARRIGSCKTSRSSRRAAWSSGCRTGGNRVDPPRPVVNVKIDARKGNDA